MSGSTPRCDRGFALVFFLHSALPAQSLVNEFSFEDIAEAAQEIRHHSGAFQNRECAALKDKLGKWSTTGVVASC